MRRKCGPVLCASAAILMALVSRPAQAEIEIFKVGKETSVSVSGELTARHSYEDWFQEAAPHAESDYNYFFTRTRLGVAVRNPHIGAFVQAQDVHMWNVPEHAQAPNPQGPLGIGAIYNLHRGARSTDSLIVRQAYLSFPNLFVKNLSARIGRFDFAEGQEVMYENQKVTWLKNMRISERLIGPFDWSSFNRSFDGLQVNYDGAGFGLTGTATHPTQGGFEKEAHKTISAIDLVTLSGTIKYNQWLKNTEGRVFYYYYNDDRRITNTPGQSGLEEGNIRINTFGANWLRTETTKAGVVDMLFWGALQEGEWGAVDHRAWAAAIEGGFQFTKLPWKPWVRGGYAVSSGDSDPNDGVHETFYQLLPTARKYALFPLYNMMNSEDLFVQVIAKPGQAVTVRADLHAVDLHEAGDLWYMGAGPTQKAGAIFGYIGRPSNNQKDLATIFEIVPSYAFSKHFSANLYYGHAFGHDVIKSIYGGDQGGDFFSLEFKAQF